MSKIFHDNNIVKSNNLITASYDLNLQEQRLILAILGKHDQKEEMPRICTLKVSEFEQIFSNIKLDFYKELKNAVNSLYDRDIKYMTDGDKDEGFRFRFVSSIKYSKKDSEVIICWSPEILPYISLLKTHFTTYKLNEIVKLRSIYSIRLFELFQQKYDFGEIFIKVNDFRVMFKLENKYSLFSNLRKWVIEPALKEIFLKLNIKIDFKAEKMGRSYEYLRFTWENTLNIPERLKITKVTNLDNPK